MKTRWPGVVGLLFWIPWACGSPQLAVLHSFGTPEASAAFPSAALIEGSDGALYGTAASGGKANVGVIFRVNKDGSGFQLLKSFEESPEAGRRPAASLVEGPDGALYGTTDEGGAFDRGTAFRLNKDGGGFAVLKSFGGEDGAQPVAALLLASDGWLYGTASGGGDTNDAGVVFRVATNGANFSVLQRFAGTNGASPEGPLFEASDGLLYGTTHAGGQSKGGTVFRLGKDGGSFEVLKQFTAQYATPPPEGGNPLGGLVEDTGGWLYGIASTGGSNGVGTVFRLQKDGTEFTVVSHLGTNVPARPLDGLLRGGDGMLYGTASGGGSNNNAVLYRVNPADGSLQVLTNLPASDGPPFALMEAADGMLYGTTQFGGKTGAGTVFRFAKDGTGLTILLNLDRRGGGGESGCAALTAVSDGRLYGVTRLGGGEGGGTVFSIKATGQDFQQVYDFGASGGGREPVATLLEGQDGWLYGSTAFGGQSNRGTLFRIERTGSGYATVYDAVSSTAGYGPRAALIQHSDGTLFGVMSEGGASCGGGLFRVEPAGFGYSNLYSFAFATGASPMQAPTLATDGYLYGTAALGGPTRFAAPTNAGSLFRIRTNGADYIMLVAFSSVDARGGYPFSPLLTGRDGMLYGAAYGGGPTNSAGTVFRVNTDGSGFQVLRAFTGMNGDGRHPCGPLVQAVDGAIYGTTESGGANGMGTLYQVNPDGSGYTVLASFDETTGKFPRGGVVALADGAIYGATDQGGAMSLGTVFRYGLPYDSIVQASSAAGQVALDCFGEAGALYRIERISELGSASGWETIHSTNAPALGRFQVLDRSPPADVAFYRMKR